MQPYVKWSYFTEILLSHVSDEPPLIPPLFDRLIAEYLNAKQDSM